MATGQARPRHNLADLRARFGKSGGSNTYQSGSQITASGSKFAFRDPSELNRVFTDQAQQPPPPLKRNATSAGLGARTSPRKAAPPLRARVASAPDSALPHLSTSNKGKQRADPPVDESGIEEDLDHDAFWADVQQDIAHMEEMQAATTAKAQETQRGKQPSSQRTMNATSSNTDVLRPLSPRKNHTHFPSHPSAIAPPTSSGSTVSSSSRSQRPDLLNTSTSSDSGNDKLQADLVKAQAQKEHYQHELLECVTTGSCESGMESNFLEQLLKGVNKRIQTLQADLENQQFAPAPPKLPVLNMTFPPRQKTPDMSAGQMPSPLAGVRPPTATAPKSTASMVNRSAPPSSSKSINIVDDDEPILPFDVDVEKDEAVLPAAANQSDEFDNMYSDFDAAELDHLDAPGPADSDYPRPRKSTPNRRTVSDNVNASKNTIIIDDSESDDDRPIASRHFQLLQQRQKQQQQQLVASTSKSVNESRPSGPDPRLSQHPWSRDVFKALSQVFKLPGFRKNQLEAINASLGGQDVFVLMPTGGGKSLCYQLPAVVHSGKTRGITIVISPLISLIQDQINALVAKGISALPFNGDMDREQRDFVLGEMRSRDPTVGLIYVTPEMLSSSNVFAGALERLHSNSRLARFVVDEAHCISTWGHDYRPAYKELDKLKRNFPDIPIIALTATANSRVRQDVVSNLGLKSPVVLTQSFNRTNLHYDVRKKEKGFMEQIATFIKKDHQGECGIIYCLSKKNCEDVAAQLRSKHGIKAMHYHAGMDKNDRKRVQLDWQSGKLLVICATIAFGMGIDKENCRFVVHHSLPKSLEGYYQETGRAGRDGNPSICILYFAYSDSHSLNRLIDMGDGSQAQKERAKAEVRHVVQYCMNTTDCRRAQVLNYFGEQFDPQLCGGACDICAAGPQTQAVDVTDHAKAAVELVRNLTRPARSKVTLVHCVDVFRGSRAKKILDAGHDEVEGYAAGSSLERGDAERLFQQLVNCEVLSETAEQTGSGFSASYLGTGKFADAVLAGKRNVSMHLAAPKPIPPPRTSNPSAGSKTKVAARKRPNQTTWESDGDGDFIGSEEEEGERTNTVEASRVESGSDANETLYAALQTKSRQIVRKQPALADMLSEELLQEIVLMAPGSVDELFEWDSLSSWSRRDLNSNRKIFSDLLNCAKSSSETARDRAMRRISGYAYDQQQTASRSSTGAKESKGSGAGSAPRHKASQWGRTASKAGSSGGRIMAAPM